MKIYIAHSKLINYVDELYNPIKTSSIYRENEIILPHLLSDKSNNTRDFYKTIDMVIAECSEAAIGLGIELGWLYDDNKRIYCIHKKGKMPSSSINVLTDKIYEYKDQTDMMKIINKIIKGEL